MNNIRWILIIAAALVVAVLAIKVVLFVTSILISLLVSVAIFAAAVFLLYWLVTSTWSKHRHGRNAGQTSPQ